MEEVVVNRVIVVNFITTIFERFIFIIRPNYLRLNMLKTQILFSVIQKN